MMKNYWTWVAGALSKRSPRSVDHSGASAQAERPRHPAFILLSLTLLILLGCQNTEEEGLENTEPSNTSAQLSTESAFAEQLQAITDGTSGSIVVTKELVTSEQFQQLQPHAERIEKIEIIRAELDQSDFDLLATFSNLNWLRLDLPIDDTALSSIAQCQSLRILNLPQGQFTDQPLEAISKLKRLELFRFHSPNVTDAGMKQIANLPKLKYLHLLEVPITDAGLIPFHDRHDLQSFYLDGSKVTDDGLRALLKANPELHLHRDQLHLPEDPLGKDHESIEP
ncbi:hypothetical protein [Rubinisphaera italica]|nr:hypothetical protein [Rubinisphaera italica]